MTDFGALLKALVGSGVEFIVVGGFAATTHGSPRFTSDLDIVYRRSPENMKRVVRALAPHAPYLRGAPPGLPFAWEESTLAMGLNFTLETRLLIEVKRAAGRPRDFEAIAELELLLKGAADEP